MKRNRIQLSSIVFFIIHSAGACYFATVATQPWHWIMFSAFCLFALLRLVGIFIMGGANRPD